MPTTVTLEPDIAAWLSELSRKRGISFNAAVHSALRAGLAHETLHRNRERTRNPGVRPGVDLTKALELADALEDERQLAMGK